MCSAVAYSPNCVALANPLPVIADGLILVVQVEAEHLFRLLRGLDRLGNHHRHAAHVVDLVGKNDGVLQFFVGMHLQLRRDVHVGSALQHLGIVHISNNGLVFPGQIFIEQGDQFFAGDFGCFRWGRWLWPLLSPRS